MMKTLKLADLNLLHPNVVDQFRQLFVYMVDMYRLGETKTRFEPFEAYRGPAKQVVLYNSGRRVTKVKAFESPHQYGLAVDFVPVIVTAEGNDQWNWDPSHDYPFLKAAAARYGLTVPIAWDPGHVESPLWKRIRKQWV